MSTWLGAPAPEFTRIRPLQWLRLVVRAVVLVAGTAVLLLIYSLMRVVDLLVAGTPSRAIARIWARLGCFVCGLSVKVTGTPMQQGGARVANHCSWSDVFVLLAAGDIYFVAKSEVRSWPFMGWLAHYTGTMFVERRRQAAKVQETQFLERIHKGHRLCFFPEGTSTDGTRVLPFKSTLFAAFTTPGVRDEAWLQPVSVFYRPRDGVLKDYYGWWGEIGFAEHFAHVMATSTGGVAQVIFHEPVRASDFPDRKALAKHCETEVRAGFAQASAAASGAMDRA